MTSEPVEGLDSDDVSLCSAFPVGNKPPALPVTNSTHANRNQKGAVPSKKTAARPAAGRAGVAKVGVSPKVVTPTPASAVSPIGSVERIKEMQEKRDKERMELKKLMMQRKKELVKVPVKEVKEAFAVSSVPDDASQQEEEDEILVMPSVASTDDTPPPHYTAYDVSYPDHAAREYGDTMAATVYYDCAEGAPEEPAELPQYEPHARSSNLLYDLMCEDLQEANSLDGKPISRVEESIAGCDTMVVCLSFRLRRCVCRCIRGQGFVSQYGRIVCIF